MARLTSVSSWLMNFGKSIGYSAKDVLTDIAPNTTKIVEDAGEEIYNFREFMSDYKSKGKQTERYLDLTDLQKEATGIIDSTINDIKTGNFAAPRDDFGDIFGGDDLDFDTDDYTSSEDQDENGVQVRKLNVSTDAKATARATVKGNLMIAETLEKSSKAQMTAQVNTSKAIMNVVNNIGMITVNRLGASISETNKRLDQINSNVVSILKFMNENQSKVNQAQLEYLKSAQAYMKVRLEMIDPKFKKNKENATQKFISGGSFDLPSYISVVKGNLEKNSTFSQLQAMVGMGSMMGSMMEMFGGPDGVIRPAQLLMSAGMKKLIPKKIQKAIERVDDLLPKALMGGLSTLSDMRDEPGLKGMLGTLLGVGSKRQKSFSLGNYYKGAVAWDGKSKRALEVVIPHYLAMIEANTKNIPKMKGIDTSPEFYDYETGTFRKQSDIRERLKTRTSDVFRGASSDSISFFNAKFSEDENLQEKAKNIMWKHLQPMIFGEKTLENEDDLTSAARAYAKDLESLKLNPYEISQLVIYFKSTVTRLRQYMGSLQLSESEQELFNRRDTDDFGFIKRGFDPRDLGNIYTATDLSKKEERDKRKAEEAKSQLDDLLERARGTVFASSKQKNRAVEDIKYNAREGIGTTYSRIRAATNVEAAGLGLINLISGYESLDTSGGVRGAIDSAKSIYSKNKYDHLTVDDAIHIMRKCGYNPDQYDFITADSSGNRDGLFGFAVLKFRYGRVGCLRVIKRRNIIFTGSKKKTYTIGTIDNDDITVSAKDLDKDLQPPRGSDFYSIENTSLPRTGRKQAEMDLEILSSEGQIDERPQDTRSLRRKARDAISRVLTGYDPYEEELKRQKEEREKKKDEGNTASINNGSNSDSGDETKPDKKALGHGPGKRRGQNSSAFERSKARTRQNTNAASEERAQARKVVEVQAQAINESVYQLSAASDVIKDSFTKGDKSANTLWNKIKSKIGLNKHSAKRGAIGGIVGSLFLPGGPIGGAIIGATIGIATSGIDFKKIIFGSKTVDDDGTVHYEKTGVLGQWQNMLQNEGKSVVQNSFDSIKREVSSYAKAQFAPVIASLQSPNGKNLVSKTMVQTIQKVGENVVDIIAHPMDSLNNLVIKISGAMLRSTIKTGAGMVKLVSKGALWAASKPAQLAADIWASRNAENPLRFISNVRAERAQRNRARRGAKINYYTSGKFFGSLKDSAITFGKTRSLTKARAQMADTRVSFFDDKYSKEKARLDAIREAMSSSDPAERQKAIEAMLPKDKNGNVKDAEWNALKQEDGSIDPADLDAYMTKHSKKLLNSKEQALAGLSAGAKYEKERIASKNKAKFSNAISKFNKKDAYKYKNLTDEEFEKRRKLLDTFAERDENGNFVDVIYARARENKEDLDKFTKNRAELEKEFARRDAKKKEEEEKAKMVTEERNYRMSQMAINIAQLEATLGRKISFDYEYGSDSYSAILSATDSAMTDAADDKKEKEEDQASIAEAESRRKKSAEAELAGETRRSEQKSQNAAELEAVQSQGRDKVQDETAQTAEDDKATVVEGSGAKATDEKKESSPLSDFLKKAGMAAGGVAIAAGLLNTPAGKAVINVLGNVIGGALKTIGSSITDWVKDGLGDLATNIVDGVRNLLPGGSDNVKEMKAEDVADINPDYVDAGTTVDENGNEVVTTTVNNDKAFALTNFGKRVVSNHIQTGGKSTKAYAKVAGFAVNHADDAYKAALKVGKVGLKGADMVTNLIPGVSTAKKIVGGVGKGTAAVAKGAAGLLSKVTRKASNLTTAGWAATNGNKALEMLTNILDTLTAALEKFSKCKQLSSLIKDFSPTTLIKAIKDKASAVVNAAKAGIKDSRIGKIISNGYTKITTGTLGQAVKTATLVVSGVWSAATGALDAANLFMVDKDSVDITMRTVSAIISLLIDFVPVVGPIFDLFSTLSEALGFSNFKRDLAEGIYEVLYNLFGLKNKGIKTVDQRQEEYEKEYQQYLTDHGLTTKDLSIVEYNDIANQTVGSKMFNKATSWLSGIFKKSDDAVTQTGVASSYAASSNTASPNTNSNKSTPASSYLGGGTGSSKSGSALGYGMAQDDPSYAGIDLGTLPDGSRANMANSGCGPTALANAVNAIGGDANPGEVGVYAKKRGMLTQGGANSKLFTEGAKKYGLQGTEISGMDSLDSSLADGNPVIVSGKSMGYGCADGSCSLYTKAGHIVTVKGKTSDGNYRVDDGEGESIVSPEMLQNGATHAFSMKRLGGAATMGTTASQGVDVSAAKKASAQTAANANVMQDNGSTIQHGAYYFAQNDPTWSGQTLSGYSSAIKNSGCVMTSAAMGTSTILGKPIDPGTFNQYGNGNVHSTNFGNLGVKVTRVPANGSQGNVQNSSQYLDQIVSALKQRKMVMMYGGKSASNMYNDGNPNGNAHCVLATGLDSSGNIIVNNPWAASPPYSQVKSASVAYPPVPSSVDPFYWAQIIETPDGKGASTTLDSSGISGVAAGGAAGTSGASGATAGTDGTATGATTGTAADGSTTESSSSGNLFDAIFNAMGNIVTKVGSRLTNSVMSGKSYDEVKAEEEASAATTGATDTTAATGYGTGVSKEQQKANTLRERGKITDKALKAKLSKAELSKVNFGPDEDIGHGTGTESGYISGASDYMDQIVSLLTDIRDNTGNMKTGGALGNGTKTETGKNTNASKSGNKTDTQKKQRARDSAKSKLSSLNNGLNSDSLSRSNLRSTYAKLASF